MHILLSGASGFLGSACVDLLRRFPEIELSVVRSSRVECVLPLGSREITLLDPTDYSALEKGLGARTPTHIMHLGGVSSPSACEQDPTLAYRGNVEFTKTLVRYAKQTAAHISLVSTDLVFDGARAPPGGFDETATPLPLSHYSRSKVAAEVETLSYHKGCVVRLALLYGHSFSKSRGVLGWMEETLLTWREFKTLGPLAGGGPINADGFIQMLDARGLTVNEACKDQMATESRNFTIQASGTVGEVTRTITTVMRVYNAVEELYYYSVR